MRRNLGVDKNNNNYKKTIGIGGPGMLILTRRVGETLMIGDNVTVTVLGVKGNQVRIGVSGPKMWPCIAKKFMSAYEKKKKLSHKI